MIYFACFIHLLIYAKTGEDFSLHICDLGRDLLENLEVPAKPKDNVIISPYSINAALLLTASGASGKTFKEFMSVLHSDFKDSESILTDEKTISLHNTVKPYMSANSMWVHKKNKINTDYMNSAEKTFNSSIISADFSSKQIVAKINSWISEKTNGTINNTVKHVDTSVAMLLINTLYFNGKWEYPFYKDKTMTGRFTLLDKTTEKAAYMMLTHELSYFSDKEFAAALLPFSNGPSLLLIKPQDEGEKALLTTASTSLTSDKVDYILSKAKLTKLNVRLPRLTATFSTSLKRVLGKLGLNIAFSSEAEFPHISPRPLQISEVLHDVSFSLDEEGAVASAATVVEMIATMAPPGKEKKEKPPTYFHLDRPFVLVLLDGKTPLFMGVIRDVNPSRVTYLDYDL